MKIIVIGSGVSGLTAACALARAGHSVRVFEQAEVIGGVTASYARDGFCWDLGQLLVEGFGPDEPAGRVLARLGVADAVAVRVDERGYVFPDFELRKPAEFAGARWRIERLKELFPAEAAGLERYWQDYLRFTRLMTVARGLDGAGGAKKLLLNLRLAAALLPFWSRKDWSAQRLMDSYFRDPRLQAVFLSILADLFTPPSQFPGLGVFSLNPEAAFEKRSPTSLAPGAEQLHHYSLPGGTRRLVQALAEQIRACGGRIDLARTAARIEVQDGRVSGVRDAAGAFEPAEVVIASGGVRETFLELVGAERLPADFVAGVKSVPLMDSVFMVHLGVDFDPSPFLHGGCTYVYGTYDVEGGIRKAREGIYHEGEDGYVVHVPSLAAAEMAPAGMHAVTIYTICPDRPAEGGWAERKEALADRLVACAERRIPGLAAHTRVRGIFTPEDFRARTHLKHHAFGGAAPVLGAWKARHKTPIEGLWFVGAQSESGGGVAAVLGGAYQTAAKIIAGR